MAAAVAGACDVGKQHEDSSVGPAITIRGLNVGDGRPMPADGVVQVAVDRYLLPSSVSRQSVVLVDGANKPLPPELAANVSYDPIARTVTLSRPAPGPWLTPGQPYKVLFTLPKNDADPSGLRAIDRATLDPRQPLAYAFFVDTAAAAPRSLFAAMGEPEDVSFCKDVLPIFLLKCSTPSCHGSGDRAAASLVLDSATGVLNTARNRVAQSANVGALGRPQSEGPLFGVDMPLIAVDESTQVGSPGNSWLLYKIDLARQPDADAGTPPKIACSNVSSGGQTTPYVPLAPIEAPGDAIERGVLDNLVTGREMPYPFPGLADYTAQPLTFQERETIRMWIARGAATPACGACGVQ